VDDMFLVGNDKEIIQDLKIQLSSKFDMKDLGAANYILGMEIKRDREIFLAKNPAYHSKTKHIDVQYHFVRDMIEDKKVLLVKVDNLKNIADALTKSVSSEKFS